MGRNGKLIERKTLSTENCNVLGLNIIFLPFPLFFLLWKRLRKKTGERKEKKMKTASAEKKHESCCARESESIRALQLALQRTLRFSRFYTSLSLYLCVAEHTHPIFVPTQHTQQSIFLLKDSPTSPLMPAAPAAVCLLQQSTQHKSISQNIKLWQCPGFLLFQFSSTAHVLITSPEHTTFILKTGYLVEKP